MVGCGRMGAFTAEVIRRHAPACWFPLSHAEAIRRHPRLELQAFCDVDPVALRKAAAEHKVKATYTDVARLLDDVHPLVLAIATRTIGRAALISQAIEGGVRALHVEKPLCNGVRELAALEAAFARSGVLVTYGAIRRHLAPYRFARELAASGRYGSLREIRVQLGAGALFWTHAHSVDLLLFAAGDRRVAGVQAHLAEVRTGTSPLDIVSDPRVVAAAVHFDDGVAGIVTQALGSDVVLSCSEGEIAVRADGGRIEVYAAPADEIYPVATPVDASTIVDAPGGTLAPISKLVAAFDGDSAALAEVAVVQRDLLAGQRILFAMLQSHLEGARVVDPATVDENIFIQARSGDRHA